MLLARIVEEACVGCTKCIAVCPVDAIVGASSLMHTVLTDECIGCRLCIEPCPMDCIELIEHPEPINAERKAARAQQAKKRYQHRRERLNRQSQKLLLPPITAAVQTQMQEDIQAAFERVQTKRRQVSETALD